MIRRAYLGKENWYLWIKFYHLSAKFLPKFEKMLEFLMTDPSYDKFVGLIFLICLLNIS